MAFTKWARPPGVVGPVMLPAGEPPEDVHLAAFPAVGHRCVHVVAPQVDLEVVGVRRLVIVVAGPYRDPEAGVGDAVVLAVARIRVAGEGAEELDVGSVHESSPSNGRVCRCSGVLGVGRRMEARYPELRNRGRERSSRTRLFHRAGYSGSCCFIGISVGLALVEGLPAAAGATWVPDRSVCAPSVERGGGGNG